MSQTSQTSQTSLNELETKKRKLVSSSEVSEESEKGLLLFISVADEPFFYCYSTPLTEIWTEELINSLNMSIPSKRIGIIPGCTEDGEFNEDSISIWTNVKEEDVCQLKNVKRIVLGFLYE